MSDQSLPWRDHPFFDKIPLARLQGMQRLGQLYPRAFLAGEVLHLEGERCQALEIILSGEVYVHSIAPSGDYFTVGDFGPGQLLGGNLVFSRQPSYPMTLSGKRAGQLLVIPREALFSLCSDHPAFLRDFLAHISDHAIYLGDRLRTQGRLPLRGRLSRYLLREAQRQGSQHLRLPVSKTELAALLGVRRSSLSREMAAMRQEGLIAFDNRNIQLIAMREEEEA